MKQWWAFHLEPAISAQKDLKTVTLENRKGFILFIFLSWHYIISQMKGSYIKTSDEITSTSATRSLDHSTAYNERLISIITLYKMLF